MKIVPFLRQNAPWLGAGAMLTFLSSFGQTFFISIFAGEIQTSFGLSHGAWGGIYSLGTMASAIVMVWSGSLTDRFRVRSLGAWVLGLLALSCLAMAVNPWAALLPAVIFALRLTGQGMASHLGSVAMARWFVASRGRALSIAGLGFAAGQAFLPIVFVALFAIVDWRWLWVVSAGIAAFGIPALMALLRKERTPQSIAKDGAAVGMHGKHWARMDVLKHPLFWMMIPALLGPAAFNTAFFFHQVHFADIKGIAHLHLVSFFPIYTVLAIISMLGSGAALDKFGTPRVIPYFQIPMVLSFLVFAVSNGTWSLGLGFFFLALTAGAGATLPAAFWAEFYGTQYLGSIKALAAAVMVLGSAIGPGITGALIDLGIGLETQFIWIAGYFAIATVMMWLGIRAARPSLPLSVAP